MKLNHAKIILQEERYLNALKVVAEAEAKEAEAEKDDSTDETIDDENE